MPWTSVPTRSPPGHYAQVVEAPDGWELHQAADRDKDQTYFLYLLNQHQLAHSLFPLADLTKAEVRRIARDAGFVTHGKKDSTGICFIGERRFRDFLARYLPASQGDIETADGEVIGRHHGLMYYTIGQRQGLRYRRCPGRRRTRPGSWRARTWSAMSWSSYRATTIPCCSPTACAHRRRTGSRRPPARPSPRLPRTLPPPSAPPGLYGARGRWHPARGFR